MSFVELPKEKFEFEIVNQDPIFEFPLGKSRFRAFTLPSDMPEKINIVVRAIIPITNVFANGKSWSPYFHPAITFLDKNWDAIITINENHPPAWCEKNVCSGVVVYSQIPSNAKYIVIHTPLNKVGEFRFDAQNYPGLTIPVNGGGFVTLPGGAGQRRSVGFSTGKLEVFLQK